MSTTDPSPSLPILESLQIASPCTADWEQMYGDERVRFCGHCQLKVYNLSGMSREEAEALVENREGRLCVRFFRRADGTVITQDCPVGLAALRQKVIRAAVGVAALAASMLGGIFAWGMTSAFRGNTTSGGLFSRWTRTASPPSMVMGGCPAPPMMGKVALGVVALPGPIAPPPELEQPTSDATPLGE